MQDDKCAHRWEMINVVYGFMITEKCFHCEKVSTYFTLEERPPLEEYREGDCYWNVMETAQTIRFDLKCNQCGCVEKFDELAGLMMCTGCDEDCNVEFLRSKLESERTWVYVAFGFLPVESKKQLSEEKIAILEDYFNQRRKSSTSQIKIVTYEMVNNIATCYGEVIKDMYMLSLTPPTGE
jgi:hypothetical protein